MSFDDLVINYAILKGMVQTQKGVAHYKSATLNRMS